MISPDLALALLINRTAAFYESNPPTYIAYDEYTHVTAPGQTRDINRSIAVRVLDNVAVMRDLPNGEERTGQAFPIVNYFDPFARFAFSWFSNIKRVDITLQRWDPTTIEIPPADQGANAVVFYFSRFDVHYAADSSEDAVHLLIAPTPRLRSGSYISEVVEDPQTQLPSQVTIRDIGSDETITLDYKVLDGHWVVVHGTFSQTMHAVLFQSKVNADVTFSNITFPAEAPDARLIETPSPSASPTDGSHVALTDRETATIRSRTSTR
jgi:hypothetical protein